MGKMILFVVLAGAVTVGALYLIGMLAGTPVG
jgi:hypothetical protein